MLKRSFYFTLFFLSCCGETQAMLSTVVVAKSDMKKVQSQQELDSIIDRAKDAPPRRLAMSDSGILTTPLFDITSKTINGGQAAVKNAQSELPASVSMTDDAQEELSEKVIGGKDMLQSPKTSKLVLAAVAAKQTSLLPEQGSPGDKKGTNTPAAAPSTTTVPNDEYVEETIVFPGYIKTIFVKKCLRSTSSNNWYDGCCGY